MTKPLMLLLAALAAACTPDEPPPEPKPAEGRAETQAIRNTEAVGVPGGAIADKVDGAIEQGEEADRKLKEEADRQSAEE
jgi:hypothetical protein